MARRRRPKRGPKREQTWRGKAVNTGPDRLLMRELYTSHLNLLSIFQEIPPTLGRDTERWRNVKPRLVLDSNGKEAIRDPVPPQIRTILRRDELLEEARASRFRHVVLMLRSDWKLVLFTDTSEQTCYFVEWRRHYRLVGEEPEEYVVMRRSVIYNSRGQAMRARERKRIMWSRTVGDDEGLTPGA